MAPPLLPFGMTLIRWWIFVDI